MKGKQGKGKKSLKLKVNGDIFLRINYLYQMAHHVLLAHHQNRNLARFYITLMKKIATRGLFKLCPSVKRSICKKCDLLLIPGVSATVRIRGKRQKCRVIQCMDCYMTKRFIYNPDYLLWCERPEALYDPNEAGKEEENEIGTTSKASAITTPAMSSTTPSTVYPAIPGMIHGVIHSLDSSHDGD